MVGMNMIKKPLALGFAILLTFALLNGTSASAFDIGLSPAKVFESLMPGAEKTVVYSLTNGSDTKPLRIQVLVYDWKVNEQGDMFTPRPGSYEYSASNWVEVSPTEFVVKPRQTQLVRATFKVPADAKGGDYLTAMLFRQRVIVPPLKSRLAGQIVPEGLIGSIAYINVPPSTRTPSLTSMKFLPPQDKVPGRITFTIKNEGNSHIRPNGNVEIKDPAGKTIVSKGLPDLSVVLRNSEGIRTIPLEGVAPGKYSATLNLNLDPQEYKFEKGTLDFDMPLVKVAAPEKPADKKTSAVTTVKPGVKPVAKPVAKPLAKPVVPAIKQGVPKTGPVR